MMSTKDEINWEEEEEDENELEFSINSQNGVEIGKEKYFVYSFKLNGKYYNFDQTGVATGSDLPVPGRSFNTSGESIMPYVPNQVVSEGDDGSSPNEPKTVARDPQNLVKYNVTFFICCFRKFIY